MTGTFLLRVLCFCITIVSGSLLKTFSQNLFPNPGFEQYSVCPAAYGQWSVISGWQSGNGATPDYFNCGFYGPAVSGQASQGSGVVGFWGGPAHPSCPASGYSESLRATLSTALVAGKTYELSFDLRTDFSAAAPNAPNDCSRFGFYFYNSGNAPASAGVCVPAAEPQIFVPGTALTAGAYTHFVFSFVAGGNYDRVLLGTFGAVAGATPCGNYSSKKLYYNLDNLALHLSSVLDAARPEIQSRYSEGSVYIKGKLSGSFSGGYVQIERRNLSTDNQLFTEIYQINIFPDSDSFFTCTDIPPVSGSYVYRLRYTDAGGESIFSPLTEVIVPGADIGYALFPNPASSFAVLKAALPSGTRWQVICTDAAGRVLATHSGEDAVHLSLDLSNWPTGIYFFRLAASEKTGRSYTHFLRAEKR